MTRSMRVLTCLLGIAFTVSVAATSVAASGFIDKSSKKEWLLKKLDRAFRDVSKADNGFTKNRSLEQIAVGYAQLGAFDRAIKTAGTIESGTSRVTSLVWIARQYGIAGHPNKAGEVLEDALTASGIIGDKVVQSEALIDIAMTYVTLGSEVAVPGILSKSLYLAHQLRTSRKKARLFKDIATALASAGMSEQAYGVSQQAYRIEKGFVK